MWCVGAIHIKYLQLWYFFQKFNLCYMFPAIVVRDNVLDGPIHSIQICSSNTALFLN